MKLRGRIQYCRTDEIDEQELGRFFDMIRQNGDDEYFHPHPFDLETAKRFCRYKGKDLYFIQKFDGEISGYGMLRGWEEGYKIPSLGILIHPGLRGKGLGEKFMGFLHEQARKKGADRVMLKVYPDNKKAVSLYEKMGYVFSSGTESGQISGILKVD